MTCKDLTQKVIDFQFSRIHMQDQGQHRIFDEKYENQKFSDWNLNNIIHGLGLTQQNQFRIKWVGSQQNSYVDAFIYCLFQGCRNSFASKSGIFIKLKYHIYQLSAKFLKINDQKLIVQTLCSAQYAKNLVSFLNRNKILHQLIEKLVKCCADQQKCKFSSQLEDLQSFAKNFNFMKFQIIDDQIGLINHINQRFYLIKEKGCYFIVETQPEQHKIIELKKIIQNDIQQQQSDLPESKMASPPNGELHEQNNLMSEPKKIFQYPAPKFILQNGGTKKKNKKKPRYTEIQIQNDFLSEFRKNPNEKVKTIDPSLASRNQYILSSAKQIGYIEFRKSINPKQNNHQNPEIQSKSQSRQKIKKRRAQLREKAKRVKTGFIQISGDMRKVLSRNQSNSKSKSNHDITFDDRQGKKQNLKKIELNLKTLAKSKSKNIESKNTSMKKQQYMNNNGNFNTYNNNNNTPNNFHSYNHISISHIPTAKSLTPTHSSTRNSLKTGFACYNAY